MSETTTGAAAQEAQVPVSFRLSTYWKRPRNGYGPTSMDSRRVSLPEALKLLLDQLSDEEAAVTSDGQVSTIVIDWSKVPQEIVNPFMFGVRR